MERIYSKIDNRLLHVINRLEDITGRNDVIPENNFILSKLIIKKLYLIFDPHKVLFYIRILLYHFLISHKYDPHKV